MSSWSQEKSELTNRVRTSLNEVKQAAASPLVPDDVRKNFVDAVLDGAAFFGVLVKSREYGWDLPISFLSSAQEWCSLVGETMNSLEESLSSTA